MIDGLRVLITQSAFSGIGGSEVQAYELAQYLHNRGCAVTLYAWLVEPPMADILADAGLRVLSKDDPESSELSLDDFDLIWVQHEALPESLLKDMTRGDCSEGPLIVFSHMSPYEEIYIEHPYTYGLEDAVADAIAFNAPSTFQAQAHWYRDQNRLMLYPNPAPMGFSIEGVHQHDNLDSVLVVSNHPPIELQEALEALKARGVQVDTLSDVMGGMPPAITSPELLGQYACVVSIGKTVQYCLTQGTPVFLYDRFAGPGYLNDENYQQAASYNFSGRQDDDGCSLSAAVEHARQRRLSPEGLAKAIAEGYESAKDFQKTHHDEFVKAYRIDYALDDVLRRAQAMRRPKALTDQYYGEYVVQTQKMIAEYVSAHHRLADSRAEFYAQRIRMYWQTQETDHFSEDCSRALPGRLSAHNEVRALPAEGSTAVRIDFGELPCVIMNIKAHSESMRLKVATPNGLALGDATFFLHGDPQIVLSSEAGASLDECHLEADVHPLDHIPDAVYEHCVHFTEQSLNKTAAAETELAAVKAELARIEGSKWWRLHERLCSLASVLHMR